MAGFIVTGRSIDGRVYAANYGGWTSDKSEAKQFTTRRGAEMAVEREMVKNAMREPDLVIGQLRVVEV